MLFPLACKTCSKIHMKLYSDDHHNVSLIMTNTLGRYMELLDAPMQCTNCRSLGRSSISPTQSALSCNQFPIHIRVQDDARRVWRIVLAKIGNKVSLPDIWVWKMTIFYSIKYEAIVMSRMRGINVLRITQRIQI